MAAGERARAEITFFCTKKHFCSLQFCLWNTETRVAENYLLSCTKIWDFSSSFGNTVCNFCLGGILALLFWVRRGKLSLLCLLPRNFPCPFVQYQLWYDLSFWKNSPLFRQRNFMQKATLETPTKLGHTILVLSWTNISQHQKNFFSRRRNCTDDLMYEKIRFRFFIWLLWELASTKRTKMCSIVVVVVAAAAVAAAVAPRPRRQQRPRGKEWERRALLKEK